MAKPQRDDVFGSSADLSAKRVAIEDIPVIDVGRLGSGDAATERAIADAIGAACRGSGFFYVKNHGIAPALTERLVAETAAFFDLPLATKLKYDIDKIQRHRGYVPYGGLYADPTAKPDVQEAYEVSLELPADDPDYRAGNIMYGPNVWPDELPGFRPGVYAYYEAALALGRRLFRALEMTLGLPAGWFDDKIDKPMGQLRLIHSPPQAGRVDAEIGIGIGAHTDYECFTLLLQTEHGLQVKNATGEWIEAPPIPGTLVINIGDMLMRWTNGEFASTPHRVINRSGRKRYSFPLFFGANHTTVARCLPAFCSAGRPAKYPPTRCGWWTEAMITDVYEYRRAHRGTVPGAELAE
ncbi:MAG: isopenicillin N synthase family oxygenase [Alphaproteobacteria bacterium]|nr:isopenicillin N synthase family oxygenase [Alphaproteobacteria bacterium]